MIYLQRHTPPPFQGTYTFRRQILTMKLETLRKGARYDPLGRRSGGEIRGFKQTRNPDIRSGLRVWVGQYKSWSLELSKFDNSTYFWVCRLNIV